MLEGGGPGVLQHPGLTWTGSQMGPQMTVRRLQSHTLFILTIYDAGSTAVAEKAIALRPFQERYCLAVRCFWGGTN
jgi:hypothetical protein